MTERRLEAGPVLRAPAAVLIAGLLFGLGCQTENSTPELAETSAALAGGLLDAEFTGACAIEVLLPPDPDDPDTPRNPPERWCSCTLVADRIVMTAAHCLEENLTAPECADSGNEPPCDEDIDLRFGTDFDTATKVALEEIRLHRYYDPDKAPGVNDIALIRLAEDPPGTPTPAPVTLNEMALDTSIEQMDITFVGYGVTASDGEDFGTRLRIDTPIRSVGEDSLLAGTGANTPCRGDNGGPGFFDFGAGPVQITLNSNIVECNQSAKRTRVDVFVDEFIYPFIDSYIGPCALDTVCVTSDCRTPDPDCDETGCSTDGTCVEECPTRDFDCPLGVFPRGECAKDGDCELGGHCITALDDDSFTYCTLPCEVDDDCPANDGDMVCNSDGDCEFTIPSPGSQGRPCGGPGECRSEICEQDICAVTCGTDADCPAAPEGENPYRCLPSDESPGDNVCIGTIVTGGGGFCDPNSITGRGAGSGLGGIAVMFLAALALVFRSRRSR
jgi:hypothetical protein